MSATASPLLPLPLEVVAHILRFCDPATLGQTSRVSLAFLEMSIPILHDEIHIEGFEKLEMLFCRRDGPRSQSLNTTLSLRDVRKFTLDSTAPPRETSHVELSLDRVAPELSNLLPVVKLDLGVYRRTRLVDASDLADDDHLGDPKWTSILLVFDPETVRIRAFPSAASLHQRRHALINLVDTPWPRVRSVDFQSSTSVCHLGQSRFLRLRSDQNPDRPDLTLIFTFAEEDFGVAGLNPSVGPWDDGLSVGDMNQIDLATDEREIDLFADDKRLAEVIIRVGTESQRQEYKEALQVRFGSLGEPERKRRLGMIRYEVTGTATPNVSTAA